MKRKEQNKFRAYGINKEKLANTIVVQVSVDKTSEYGAEVKRELENLKK